MKNIAIIGGTGVYSDNLFGNAEILHINTEYGTAEVLQTSLNGNCIYFLERHSKGHASAPHEINYRANIKALKILGAEWVIASAAVGSLNEKMIPGCFVILDDFIDFTKKRPLTFFENSRGVVHVDMSTPYCPELRSLILKSCRNQNITASESGTYICTEGPRFETKAEIKMYKQFGADVVGMTNVPEVVLAREANICYATIALVTNFAAGITENPLTIKEVTDNMKLMTVNLGKIIADVISNFSLERECGCKDATAELGSLK